MNWFGRWLFIFLGLAAWERSARAAAWIETTVTSDVVTVQVERDGRATVAHALALKIRGGPLKSWTLQGIDADAEPCLLYTSDAADEEDSVDLGGRRII